MQEINVEKIFGDSLVQVTKQIAGLELQLQEQAEREQTGYMGIIHTKGRFGAAIQFLWTKELYEYIVSQMTAGEQLPEEEQLLYMNEYMNITCGHALSVINNELGKPSSRLSVPEIHKEILPDDGSTEEKGIQAIMCYNTGHGTMKIEIAYTIEAAS